MGYRSTVGKSVVAALALTASGCASEVMGADEAVDVQAQAAPLSRAEARSRARAKAQSIERGRETWVKSTFGGEKFFSLIMPSALGLHLGLDVMLQSPRASRFDDWGVVNDPDCTAGDASTYNFDRCDDPNSAGVVGVRKFDNPNFNPSQPIGVNNPPVLLGVSCAGCHAGFDAENPPTNPNAPQWDNIHLTTGNQFDQVGKIFGAHLPPTDPKWQVFNSWAPGTVDTTAIESDGINNPGTITQFFEFDKRPYFDHSYLGTPDVAHRAGQGGEDDVGCELAALRVYFNVGMCAAECVLPHLAGGQSPIDLAECEAACPDYLQAKEAVTDMCVFMNDTRSTKAPKLRKTRAGRKFIDRSVVGEGRFVFATACASCHDSGARSRFKNSFTDDEMLVASGFDPVNGEPEGAIGTHKCRSLSTNWLDGNIWANFTSDETKARGAGYYRTIPLLGVWATAPFLHNNRLGMYNGDPSIEGRIEAYEDAFDQLLNPGMRDFGASIPRATVDLLGGAIPAGTPVNAFANVDQTTGVNLCAEYVENGGHYYGADLTEAEKYALREYMKTL